MSQSNCSSVAMEEEGFGFIGLPRESDQTADPEQEGEQEEPTTGRRGPGRGRGRGRGRPSSAAGGSKGRGRGKKAPASTCICPNCTAPKYPGSKFCSLFHHKKAFDNMMYQRRTRALSQEAKEAFDKVMANQADAGRKVEEFALDATMSLESGMPFLEHSSAAPEDSQ